MLKPQVGDVELTSHLHAMHLFCSANEPGESGSKVWGWWLGKRWRSEQLLLRIKTQLEESFLKNVFCLTGGWMEQKGKSGRWGRLDNIFKWESEIEEVKEENKLELERSSSDVERVGRRKVVIEGIKIIFRFSAGDKQNHLSPILNIQRNN